MTLSEFLEKKKEREQLPQKDAPIYIYSKREQLPSTEVNTVEPNSTSPVVGQANTAVILGMLADTVATRNFNLTTLTNSEAHEQAFMNSDINALLMQGKYAKMNNVRELINSTNRRKDGDKTIWSPKDVKTDSQSIQTLATVNSIAANERLKTEQKNIKGTGLAVDGFSGGPQRNELPVDVSGIKTNIIGNIGTMKEGSALSDSDRAALRKVHLRNYWKYEGSQVLSPKEPGRPSISNAYRDLLNKRLTGVRTSVDNPLTGSFLTGYGLSREEYKSLMENDSINPLINTGKKSLEGAMAAVAFGMESKRDTIIDTGRFSYSSSTSKYTQHIPFVVDGTPINMSNSVNGSVLFNISSFGADPAHTPFFRKQLIALGNEVTTMNLVADRNYVHRKSFNIKFINLDSNSSARPQAHWKRSNSLLGDSGKTPISVIANRFPDFMSNMHYVFLTRKNSDNNNLVDIMPARIVDITVKMPEAKVNTIDFVNRQISTISASVTMSHIASIKVRLDENLSIWKEVMAASGILLKDFSANAFNNKRDLKNQYSENNHFKGNITALRNGLNQAVTEDGTKVSLDLDLYIAYNIVNNFIPIKNPTDPSTPFSKSVINYQHDNSDKQYSRYYIFTGVKFLGVPELELAKDSEQVEMSFEFTFKNIEEADYGHQYGGNDSGSTNSNS